MNSPMTQKSVRFLAQPYTLLALTLYAVNEFILQRYFPSWLSGKLSDFAWLFIAPVILTLLLSLILPSKRTNTIPILAYALTAIGFTAIKTIPAANTFLLQTWQTIFHHPAAIAMDATDLLALLVLPLSWILLQEKGIKWKSTVYQTAIMISFFALLTLADAPAPDYGIQSVGTFDGELIADASHKYYCSKDGGLNWHTCGSYNDTLHDALQYHTLPYSIQIPQSEIQYLITENGAIKTSQDGGTSWHKLDNQDLGSDVTLHYQAQTRPNAYIYNPGAQDMVYEPISGNLVIAMGLQGVIVIPKNGEAIMVGVGDNHPVQLTNASVIFSLLFPIFILAVLYIAFCFGVLITISRSYWYWLLNLVTLLVWGFTALTHLDIFSGYAIVFGLVIVAILIILYTALLFAAGNILGNLNKINKQTFIMLLKNSLPGGLVYFLCNILWYSSILPNRQWADNLSLSMALIWFIYCVYQSYQLKKSLGETNE